MWWYYLWLKDLHSFAPTNKTRAVAKWFSLKYFPAMQVLTASLSNSLSLFHALLGKHCMRTFLWLLSTKIYCNLFSGKPSNQPTENMQEAKKGIPHGWHSSPLCCSSRHPTSQPATIVWRVVHLKLMKKSCYPTEKPCNTLAQSTASCTKSQFGHQSGSSMLQLESWRGAVVKSCCWWLIMQQS